MKLLSGISLLLLAAIAHAAPRSPSLVYQTEQVEEEPRIAVDFWPLGDSDEKEEGYGGDWDDSYLNVAYDSLPFEGAIDLSFDVNQGNLPVLENDTIMNLVFKDLEQRIAEDIHRMEEDFLLFQKLFGKTPAPERRPTWFMPWDVPEDSPVFIPDGGEDSYDDDSTSQEDSLIPFHGSDDGNLFGGFPFLGLDRPVFSSLPDIPGVGFANPDDLPDNYSNKTHEVHSVNGSQVVVNNTINKSSGDNFNSFFHHQVIHYRPEEGSEPDVHEVPEYEVPQEEEEEEDEINTVLPAVENEISYDNFNPEVFPEVKAEILSDTDQDLPVAGEEEFGDSNLLIQQTGKRLAARSLNKFNPIVFPADEPKTAAYVSNSLTEEEEAEDIEEEFDEEMRAPDLSSDTRVNRIHANKQGITLVDPDAEIFNYSLVMKEAQPLDDEK